MKPTGTNTAARMRAIATTGPETSSIALRVAALGSMPCSMWCMTASTTTIASSTTMPIASTRPSSDSTLIEKPISGKNMNAPISETGTVISGMSVARQFCRKTKTTMMTRTIASNSVCTISVMPSSTGSVVSSEIVYSMSRGKRVERSFIVALIRLATSIAFVPGIWKTAMTAEACPLWRPIALYSIVPSSIRATSRRYTCEPSGLLRTTMLPNSASSRRRPCVFTV